MNTIEKHLKYYSMFALFFLAANMTYFSMSPRIISIFSMIQPGGIIVFPLTFFISDIITEVYGYRLARQLIWITVICLGLFTLLTSLSMLVPSAAIDKNGNSFQTVFSNYPKAFLGIAIATLAGFLSNNFILAKLKILAHGKHFWLRSIFSTSIGHAVFSVTWAMIFYSNHLLTADILRISLYIYLWKITAEILLTPFTVLIAAWLKKKEGIDVYDTDTNFSPFSMKA